MEQQEIKNQHTFNWNEFLEEFEISWLTHGVAVVFGEYFLANWMSGLKYLTIETETGAYNVGALPLFFVLVLFSIGGAIIYFIIEQNALGELTELQQENEDLTEEVEVLTNQRNASSLSYAKYKKLFEAVASKLKAYKSIGEVEDIKQKLRNDANTIIDFNKTIEVLVKDKAVLTEKISLLNNENSLLLEKHKLLGEKAIVLNDNNKVLKEENTQLKGCWENLKIVESQLKNDNSQLTEKLTELNKRLGGKISSYNKLKEKYEQLKQAEA